MGYELAIGAPAQHHTNPLKGIVQYSFSKEAILNNIQTRVCMWNTESNRN